MTVQMLDKPLMRILPGKLVMEQDTGYDSFSCKPLGSEI